MIEGAKLTKLKVIDHPQGNIYHALKKSDQGYKKFGEAYFSTILKNEVKGWKKNQILTLNLIVPVGEVSFVLFASETYLQFHIDSWLMLLRFRLRYHLGHFPLRLFQILYFYLEETLIHFLN